MVLQGLYYEEFAYMFVFLRALFLTIEDLQREYFVYYSKNRIEISLEKSNLKIHRGLQDNTQRQKQISGAIFINYNNKILFGFQYIFHFWTCFKCSSVNIDTAWGFY